MKQFRSPLLTQMTLVVALSLLLIWATVAYELNRSYRGELHEAEIRTAVQSQVFAEYSRSTLKRINEVMLDLRTRWTGDWKTFAAAIAARQENIDDLTFQVAVIDRDGVLAFSNLAKPSDRTDLSQREHFLVHKESGGADRLFISRPLLGKVSGKWSIQVTRPILREGRFEGVLVVSLSPDQFAGFGQKLGVRGSSVLTVVRDSGEIMARYPAAPGGLGQVVKGRPFLGAEAAMSGSYRQRATVDNVDRIFGFQRLPEFGMSFVVGESVDEVLGPFVSHRRWVFAGATAVTLFALVLFFILSRSLQDLEAVRRQLDAIFALSPDGFVAFDRQRRVQYVSPAFLNMIGIGSAEVIGCDEACFAALMSSRSKPEAAFPGFDAMRADALSRREDGGDLSRRFLMALSSPAGRVLEIGIRLADGELVSQVLYFRDVSHEVEVDRMKSEFLSTAAHELRTPMASIYGYSELLLAQDFPESERKEVCGIIFRQSELMVSIINELLDLVRIEERRGKDFSFARVDAAELLREAAGNVKAPEGRERPLADFPDQPYWLRADRKKLMQAIGNVVSNAYKYSPAGGGVRMQIITGDKGHPGMCGLRIGDEGIGMSPEQQARVCERFYRADASGKIPGTGLGMSIVKEIIELHGGRVEISSEPRAGTEVTLWVPLA